MLEELFLGSMIRSALGGRTRPFFGGGPYMGGGLNLGTLLGAAGLAWGAYEHFKDRTPSVMTTIDDGGFAAASPPPAIASTGPSTLPPPRSANSAYVEPDGPDALQRLVALTIAAARADGDLGEEEYGKILESAREHGAEKLVQGELSRQCTIQEIVAGANDPRLRSDLYALAFGIVRADGSISPAERKWLRELALALSLDSESASKIEQETADRIEAHSASDTGSGETHP